MTLTATELRAWIERAGLSHERAADALGLSIDGLRKQLYGQRAVSAQTARIVALLDRPEKRVYATRIWTTSRFASVGL